MNSVSEIFKLMWN